jgi:hypothetical protein
MYFGRASVVEHKKQYFKFLGGVEVVAQIGYHDLDNKIDLDKEKRL